MMTQIPRFRLQGVQRQAKAIYGFASVRLAKRVALSLFVL